MGFSLTGSHVVFFIAAVIVASTISGVFVAISIDVSTSLSDKGNRIQEQLDTDFLIINDPDNIPTTNLQDPMGTSDTFYLKNIGNKKFATTSDTIQIFLDGALLSTSDYQFSADIVYVTEVIEVYIKQGTISAGDHTLRLVGPQAVEDEFTFTKS